MVARSRVAPFPFSILMFITFEGCEASGKSAQVRLLKDFLQQKGKKVIVTKEPGGTPLAEQIRNIILAHEISDSLAEMFLLSAARRDHCLMISQALEDGMWVISDRFSDSSIAYQTYAKHLPMEITMQLLELSTSGLKPDLTLLLDVSLPTLLQRLANSTQHQNYYDNKDSEFHLRVKQGFLKIAEREPARIKVINADLKLEQVFNSYLPYIENLLSLEEV